MDEETFEEIQETPIGELPKGFIDWVMQRVGATDQDDLDVAAFQSSI